MAKNFGQLKASLYSWLGMLTASGANDTTRLPDADAGDLINSVKAEFLRKYSSQLWFGEVTDTFTTTPGTYIYTLPGGFSESYNMWYVYPNLTPLRVVYLALRTKEEFDSIYPEIAAFAATPHHDPHDYCLWGNTLELGPAPKDVLTINRNYYMILPDLSNASDHDAFTDNAWQLLLYRALAETSRYGIEDARIPVWESRATDLERALVREHSRRGSTGRVPQSQEPGTWCPPRDVSRIWTGG